PGPPFPTADGRLVEIETLDPEAWKTFWTELGAAGADLGRAWALFRARYYAGACSLPPGLRQATARFPLAELDGIARACRVSLTPVRSYAEVLAEPGWSSGHPALAELDPAGGMAGGPAPAPSAPAGYDLPLAGIRVVETTTRMQGPLAGLLLSQLGAEVIKVEPPGGDFGRVVPPAAGDRGSFFSCFNRGKRSVEIDLARPEGRRELTELVAGSDVFLHNWRPGKAAQWGLEAADLARINPRLVYTEASGWGDLDRPAALIGTDFLVQAYAGVADGVCPEGEEAVPSRVLLTDGMGALNTSEGMLAGLVAREQTGRGWRVSTSLFRGAMTLQAHVLEALAAGHETGRRNGRPRWGPLDRPIDTAEGMLVVGADDGDTRRRLARACAAPATATDQEVAGHLARGRAPEWEQALADAGVPCAALDPGSDLAALAADPRLAELFEPLGGTAVVPRSPWSFTT
ncbi:MAG TPA: CoA transferase, partial [Acidimicrobiales bacterium]|nr:CoA transferase [Acidimicrobiales bacterium]